MSKPTRDVTQVLESCKRVAQALWASGNTDLALTLQEAVKAVESGAYELDPVTYALTPTNRAQMVMSSEAGAQAMAG